LLADVVPRVDAQVVNELVDLGFATSGGLLSGVFLHCDGAQVGWQLRASGGSWDEVSLGVGLPILLDELRVG